MCLCPIGGVFMASDRMFPCSIVSLGIGHRCYNVLIMTATAGLAGVHTSGTFSCIKMRSAPTVSYTEPNNAVSSPRSQNVSRRNGCLS